MNTHRLDELVARLAPIRDEELIAAAHSAEASALFRQIIATPYPRTERLRQRRFLLAAAAAAAILIVTPALALRGQLVHLFSAGEPASPNVNRSFYSLEAGAPARFRISASARKVLEVSTPDGPVSIWAAPREVGFCYAVGTAGHEGFASTCVDGSAKVDPSPFSVERPERDLVGGPSVLVGYTSEDEATSVRIRFDDGSETSVPLTWVLPPIDAGFFALWVSKRHWLDGKERFEVVAQDTDGTELGRSAIEVGVPTP
jgi:hypothetical protein